MSELSIPYGPTCNVMLVAEHVQSDHQIINLMVIHINIATGYYWIAPNFHGKKKFVI